MSCSRSQKAQDRFHSLRSERRLRLTRRSSGFFGSVIIILAHFTFSGRSEPIVDIRDSNAIKLPGIGSHSLNVLTSRLLELNLVNTKSPDPARVTSWDFVENFSLALPDLKGIFVTADSQPVRIESLGFKRRPLYAPLKSRDLRIGNSLYILLATPLLDGQRVKVENPSRDLWGAELQFTAFVDPLRSNPAIHVNQVGYMPNHAKKAMVGYYLGSLGEMAIPVENGFQIVEARSGRPVYNGTLKLRPDRGFTYQPQPYQRVYEADFSDLQLEGQYRLAIPGMGASFPFRIESGTAAVFARSFAIGLYHQRCGTALELPFTRHVHGECHTAPAAIPTMDGAFAKVQEFLAVVTSVNEPRQTAVRLKDVFSSLYPFINKGRIDVRGGHHDAGDYSKYTINSAGLIHYLVFAADSLPGAGDLDNLGIPESGDGKSDLLQEAKWEADFLARMQDEDGGFYFLVYPKDRRYEDDVLPDFGDPQVVWPKTTAVTAAAVAALAEAGSSPRMKREFPAESASYLAKAQRGWSFLMASIDRFGKDGSYQKITHYGNEFIHDDELAWAAAALYVATGEPKYSAKLLEWFPDPNSVETRRWNWWRLFEGYGCAVRSYVFAARSGRLSPPLLDKSYLAKCEAEIIAAAEDHVRFAKMNAYGTSFPDLNKQYRSAGWYFSSERAFDVTVAYQLTNRADFVEAVLGNLNYEAGCNPLNMTFVTGIGAKRQRDIVHQYAQNDSRILPPSGIPLGNIQAGFAYLYPYTSELTALTYPPDNASSAPYPYYDRWGDSFNTTTEFVITDQARSLASLSFWMAQSKQKDQPHRSINAQIIGLPSTLPAGTIANLSLVAPGIDLSNADIVWEVQYLEPGIGNPYRLTPNYSGVHWLEAEAMLPDGRRLFAATNFVATTAADAKPNSYRSSALSLSADMVALYHLDSDLTDTAQLQQPLRLKGNAVLDRSNQGWMARHIGAALRFYDLGDSASVQVPVSSFAARTATSVVIEAMIYVNQFKAYNRSVARIFSLNETWNAYMELIEDTYQGLFAKGGTSFSFGGAPLQQALTLKEWHHICLSLTRFGYTFAVDGKVVATAGASDISNWGRAQFAKLEIGNFDGWLDEVVVRASHAEDVPLPAVSLRLPDAGTRFPIGSTISFIVDATTKSTEVEKVELFAGNSKIGELVEAPYSFSWEAPAPGKYVLMARATDSNGRTGISAPAEINVSKLTGTSALVPLGLTQQLGLRILVKGESGRTLAIQASHDHEVWADIGLVTLATENAEFVDPNPSTAHQFYRALEID